MDGIIEFGYFIRIYKTAFFWKKIKFEEKRLELLSDRRGLLMNKKYELYKACVDHMEQESEKCLNEVLEDLFDKCTITEEQYAASLHGHCQRDDKRDKIAKISDVGKGFQNFGCPTVSKFKGDYYDQNKDTDDILNPKQLLRV